MDTMENAVDILTENDVAENTINIVVSEAEKLPGNWKVIGAIAAGVGAAAYPAYRFVVKPVTKKVKEAVQRRRDKKKQVKVKVVEDKDKSKK